MTIKQFDLIDPNSGQTNGKILFQIQIKSPEEALTTDEHSVYQYQRWQPILDASINDQWGSSYPGHLLPTDYRHIKYGCWSTIDGITYGKSQEDLHPLPDGWAVKHHWLVQST